MKSAPALVLACVLALALAEEQGCEIKGGGKLSQFSNSKSKILIPCKYQATSFDCSGYQVTVNPVQKLDIQSNYYTHAVWTSIKHLASGEEWKGRTTVRHLERYLNDSRVHEPWFTRDNTLTQSKGGVIDFAASSRNNKWSCKVGIKGVAGMHVEFYGAEAGDQHTMGRNGVRVFCRKPAFDNRAAYPTSLCGNHSDKALALHTEDIGVKNQQNAIIYDVLNSDYDINNPTCEVAQRVFQRCDHKAAAIDACANILTKNNVRRCMDRNYRNPMDVFIYCLRYVCDDHREACRLQKESVQGCGVHSLPGLGHGCTKKFKVKKGYFEE